MKNHGQRGPRRTPTYLSWMNMKHRCNSPKIHNAYKYFWAGIRYDPRWEKFINFFEDMGSRPVGTTLDRIDPNKNYTFGNCRWADAFTQNKNRNFLKNEDAPF